MQIEEAKEVGTEWGKQEAALQVEAIANGHRSKLAEWTNGQWSGYIPPGEGSVEYEVELDRAAEAAYNAAIEADESAPSGLDREAVAAMIDSATLAMTASEWELYDGLPYAESVAYDLNRKFEECLARGMSGNEVHGIMFTLMQQHRAFGALDSEPQHQLRSLIRQVYHDFD